MKYGLNHRRGSIMMFLLGTVIITGMLYSVNYLDAQHEYKVKETTEVCRDLNIVVDEIVKHYSKFAQAASGYINTGTYNAVTEAELKNLWGNTGTFALPNSPEAISTMMTRLKFSEEVKNSIGLETNDFLSSCLVNSKVLLINSVTPTTIPIKWEVLITSVSTGIGEFDVNTLQDQLLRGVKDGSNAARNITSTVLDITEINRSKITLRLEFKLMKQDIINLNTYGM